MKQRKVVAINAGPRKGWNTDQLVAQAARGAKEAGAEVEYIDLYRLPKFTGCISCFACKRQPTFGACACKDGLYDVLAAIREADGLIIGAPNYLGDLTAGFRALYERLIFQWLTYNREAPCCNDKRTPVLLITTSNCAEEQYDAIGYTAMLQNYRQTLERNMGPTQLLICGNTLQVEDYGKYNWTMFDPQAKRERHDAHFHEYLERARALGEALLQ